MQNNCKPSRVVFPVNGVEKIILVASCKGGVGKSTITANLAIAASKLGKKVGLVDADIYGPSIPHLLGLKKQPEIVNNMMVPNNICGIDTLSFGYIFPEKSATIWRGPMVNKALHQLLRGSKWNNIDLLFIDMPPGTGDVYLSMAENYPVSGVVIVTTPQGLSLIDVKKSIDMFNKLNIPIIGVVENMSYFIDPVSNNKSYIFGKDGGKKLAKEFGLKFLGEIPIDPKLGEASEAGKPVAYFDPESDLSNGFKELAQQL